MTISAAQRPTATRRAWPWMVGAFVVALLATVVMPPLGFSVGILALGGLAVGLARTSRTRAVALSVGAVAAVVCYLAVWLIGSVVDPGAPDGGSGGVLRGAAG